MDRKLNKFTVTCCSQCGKNSRIMVNDQISFCKKHLPEEYKKEIEDMGFEMANL